MENQKLSFEKELENSLKVTELEQRLEMGWYCCDYPNHPISCGYDGIGK